VLAAAFVADLDTGSLRAASQHRPGPMRPRAWFPMSALPRMANGKIDRVRLRTEVTR
jgi:acyl-coenzyme A synthetase/AMP-(fatty) acid ligase